MKNIIWTPEDPYITEDLGPVECLAVMVVSEDPIKDFYREVVIPFDVKDGTFAEEVTSKIQKMYGLDSEDIGKLVTSFELDANFFTGTYSDMVKKINNLTDFFKWLELSEHKVYIEAV